MSALLGLSVSASTGAPELLVTFRRADLQGCRVYAVVERYGNALEVCREAFVVDNATSEAVDLTEITGAEEAEIVEQVEGFLAELRAS
jgi:hypothetical protein